MSEQKLISCPECKAEFPIDEVLKHQLSEDLKKEMEQKLKEREIEIAEKIGKKIQAEHSLETKDLTERLNEQTATIKNLETAELDKRRAERHLIEFQEKFAQQLEGERDKLKSEIRKDFDKNLQEVKDKYNSEKDNELEKKRGELDALSGQLKVAKSKENELQSKILEEQNKIKEKEIELERKFLSQQEKVRKKIQEEHSLETKDLTERLNEQTATIKNLETAELDKRKAERQLVEFQEKFEHQLEGEKEKIQVESRKNYDKNLQKIKEKYDFQKEQELGEKQSELVVLTSQLRDAKNKGNELQNKVLEEQNKVKEKEIEMERKFLFQKEEWRNEVNQQAQNEHKLKMDERNKQIEGLTKTINELKTKVEQGSQQIQGEVLEDNLKSLLEENFREDIIEDVPTGTTGADIIQKITYQHGIQCGVLLWECKNTGNWNNGWIDKLNSDFKAMGIGEGFPILVSRALPREITTFGKVKNVWVARIDLAVPLAKTLREAVIALDIKGKRLDGADVKAERLFKYLTSSQFTNLVVDSLEAFVQMKEQLDAEQRTFKRQWKKRELLIGRVEENMSGMHTSFGAILGKSMQELEEVSGYLLNAKDEENDTNDLEGQ